MRIDPALVSKVAALAALELSDAEREAMAGQLTRIVEHFEALRELPESLLPGDVAAHARRRSGRTSPATARPVRSSRRTRPLSQHGHFVVPRVVTRD